MKRFIKNLFRFISINLKIIIAVLVVLIGVVLIFLAFKSCYKDAVLAIGSGIFSSAFITFIFEIINRRKENNDIFKSLQELNNQMQIYNHRITQCYNCIKSILPIKNIALQKSMLLTESYNIIWTGNTLLNEINRFKSNYSLCIDESLINLLNFTYTEVENNICFISSASSNSTVEFNVEMILNKKILDNIEQLQRYIQNKKSVYYKTKKD